MGEELPCEKSSKLQPDHNGENYRRNFGADKLFTKPHDDNIHLPDSPYFARKS
jgi:hypothetical protein